jgi:hypothetical protein
VTEHFPEERVHVVELNEPTGAEKVTVPVGVVAPLPPVSATVTVHKEPWLTTTGVEQVTVVLVGLTAANGVVPMLERWSPSPP